LIIDTVDGWATHTRLYKVGDRHYLISVIDVVAVHDAVSEIIQHHKLPVPVRATGHTEIYEATVVETGCAGRRYDIRAIDADGNPLNGLTPLAVLPHGTSFDDALTFLEGLA
jgi:hypothetical protein